MQKGETQAVSVLLTFADESVGVMQFVTLDPRAGWRREASDFNIELELARSSFPQPVKSWRLLAPGEALPEGREFRAAWRDRGRVEVDMPAAREVHRERLRSLRAPRLAALDAEYLRADEAGDQAAKRAVVKAKQALRDVTADPRIAAAQTPAELLTISLPEP
jgi:hypothetical protein